MRGYDISPGLPYTLERKYSALGDVSPHPFQRHQTPHKNKQLDYP